MTSLLCNVTILCSSIGDRFWNTIHTVRGKTSDSPINSTMTYCSSLLIQSWSQQNFASVGLRKASNTSTHALDVAFLPICTQPPTKLRTETRAETVSLFYQAPTLDESESEKMQCGKILWFLLVYYHCSTPSVGVTQDPFNEAIQHKRSLQVLDQCFCEVDLRTCMYIHVHVCIYMYMYVCMLPISTYTCTYVDSS